MNRPARAKPKLSSLVDTPEDDGLLFACALDGKGGAKSIGWGDLNRLPAANARHWIHLNRSSPRAQTWLREESGITPITADALLAEETRPRVFRGKRGYVVILRGVNTNPAEDPENMVAIRIWCDGKRLISLRQRKLLTPREILAQFDQSIGPRAVADLFESIIARLAERMGAVITDYDDTLDQIEEQIESIQPSNVRSKLGEIRRQIVALRRYMTPQRDALNQILADTPDWLDQRLRLRLRETADRWQRYIEDLDTARERAVVMIDEIATRLAEAMNRNMLIFSLVAVLFLPLGFLTGLLGINVGGMPGVDSPSAFWITCGLITVVLAVELVLLRKLKMI